MKREIERHADQRSREGGKREARGSVPWSPIRDQILSEIKHRDFLRMGLASNRIGAENMDQLSRTSNLDQSVYMACNATFKMWPSFLSDYLDHLHRACIF